MATGGIWPVAAALAPLAALAGCAAGSDHMRYMNGETAVVDGKYREGNLLRVHASMSRNGSPREAFANAVRKAAEMSTGKGFERFAVIKVSECGTLMMNGSIPISNSCRILARMVGPAETAQPEGSHPVTYYRTSDVLGGLIRPEGQ